MAAQAQTDNTAQAITSGKTGIPATREGIKDCIKELLTEYAANGVKVSDQKISDSLQDTVFLLPAAPSQNTEKNLTSAHLIIEHREALSKLIITTAHPAVATSLNNLPMLMVSILMRMMNK